MSDTPFLTLRLPATPDTIAPDGSEIRFLPAPESGAASMVHCRLPPGRTSLAVRHRSVEEVWFVTAGQGELWRWRDSAETITALCPGISVTIPLGTHFQFRCTSEDALTLIIVTLPPWPGMDEAVRVVDHWAADP